MRQKYRFRRQEVGATAIEYGLIAALVASVMYAFFGWIIP
ncbi:MAG TPA: Flp family type IVb pilin [Blastocatellia bacterium]|nr:Flp family type IVb pilin [Blastocatellia bacterium]